MQCEKFEECGRQAEYGQLCLVHEKDRRKRVAAAQLGLERQAAARKKSRRRGPRTPAATTEAPTQTSLPASQTTDAGAES